MTKTVPIGKPGYSLKKAEAELLAAVFEAVKTSGNRRRKSFAVWILGEIQKLMDDKIRNVWLSEDDISTSKIGRHKLADDALEDGCAILNIEPIMLGDFPNGIDDLPEDDEGKDIQDIITETEANLTQPDVSPRITSDESFDAVQQELPLEQPVENQQIALQDATERQILESLVQSIQIQHHNLMMLAERSETLIQVMANQAVELENIKDTLTTTLEALQRRRGGKPTHK